MKQTAKIGCRVLVALLCLAMLTSVISVPTFAAETPGIPSSLAGSDLDFLMEMLEQYNKVKNDENAAEQMKEYVEDKYNSDESFKETADSFVGSSTEEGGENNTLDNMNSVIDNVFKDEFTIKWDVNGTVYELTGVPYGEKPAFPGNEEALSYEINDFRYTFTGWTPVVVPAKADATYTAVFSVENVAAVGDITVTFVTGKGTIVDKFNTEEEIAAFAAALDTDKPEDKNYTYTFKEWSVEGDTWTAVYEKAEKSKGWSDILTSGKVVEEYFGSIDEVVDAVQNGATVEDLKDSVSHQQKVEQDKAEAEEKGEVYVPVVHNVTWVLDGKQIGDPVPYDYKKLIKQPSVAGVSAGKYVSWDMTYVLMPDQDITLYGETVDIVDTIVNEINGLPINYGEYEMTYADGVATLYINVTASNYNDILRDVLGDIRGGAQSAYKEALMAFLQTAAMEMYNSKTNTIDVNGYEVFGIDGYGASQLLELLETVQAGNFGEIISVGGFKKAFLSDLVTPSDLANIGDDGVIATYDITLGATGKQDFDVELNVALKGNLDLIRKGADAIDRATDYRVDENGNLSVEIYVPAAFTKTLKKALNSASISEQTKQTIVAGISECATVGELMDLFDLLTYDQFIDVVEYLLDNVNAASEKEQALIEKIEAFRPAFELAKKYGNILIDKVPESFTDKQASVTIKSVYNLSTMVTYDDLLALAQLRDADALIGSERLDNAAARVADKLGVSRARAQEIVADMVEAFADYQNRLPDSAKAQAAYDKAIDLIDLVYNKVPEKFHDTKLTDTYQGDGQFSISITGNYNPGAWLTRVLGDVSVTVYGKTLVLADYIPSREINSDLSITVNISDLYRVTYMDGDQVVFEGFLPYGAEIAPYGKDAVKEGYSLSWTDEFGDEITNMPGADTVLYAKHVADKHTITFVVLDKTYEVVADYGTVPALDAALTSFDTLNFKGWEGYGLELPVVTGDATYVAEYTATVTFEILGVPYAVEVKYGEVPAWDATLTNLSTLNFKGWEGYDLELPAATAHATYVAKFTANVTFHVDGKEPFTVEVAYNTVPAVADPAKGVDLEYRYEFDGWYTADGVKMDKVTAHTDFYAQFNKISHLEEHAGLVREGNVFKLTLGDYVQNNNRLTVSVIIPDFLFDLAGVNADVALEVEIPGNTGVAGAHAISMLLDNKALLNIKDNATKDEITLSVSSLIEKEDGCPTFDAYYAVYSFELDGSKFDGANGGTATVVVPFEETNKFHGYIYYLNGDAAEQLTAEESAEALTFTTTHFSYYAVDYKQFIYTVEFYDVNGNLITSVDINTDNGETLTAESIPAFTVAQPTAEGHYVASWKYGSMENADPVQLFEQTARDYAFYEVQVIEAHTFGDYTAEDATHSRTCSVCGYVETEEHTYTDGKCVCGHEKEEGTTTPGGEGTTGPAESESETTPVTEPDNKNGWWIFLIILLVFIAILIVAYILYGHKLFPKNPAPEAAPAEPEQKEVTDAEIVADHAVEAAPELEEIHIVEHVAAAEVDELMSDAQAVHAVELVVAEAASGKMGAVNVGTLNQHFEAGEKVDIDVLKAKKLIDADCKRVKILADGDLDKALVVEAHSFSLQAIKMITLTGGHALKLQATAPADKADEK